MRWQRFCKRWEKQLLLPYSNDCLANFSLCLDIIAMLMFERRSNDPTVIDNPLCQQLPVLRRTSSRKRRSCTIGGIHQFIGQFVGFRSFNTAKCHTSYYTIATHVSCIQHWYCK